jgi:hypothetical protein
MRRISNRIATPLSALLFAASMTFGVSSVFAKPVSGTAACRYDPPSMLGACVSEADCDRRCAAWGGEGECIPTPDGPCCTCAI